MDPTCPFCGASDKFGSRDVENAATIVYCTACGHIIGVTPKSPPVN